MNLLNFLIKYITIWLDPILLNVGITFAWDIRNDVISESSVIMSEKF